MSVNDAVTLQIVAHDGDDAHIVRQLLPNAEERVEVVARTPQQDRTWLDVQLPVFRASFASVPLAVNAGRRLPSTVTFQVTTQATLDDRQLVILARYHIHQFLLEDEFAQDVLQQVACIEGESAYEPPAFDELPWLAASVEFPSAHRQDLYHLRHLANLELILGRQRIREMYEEMATHPPGWIDS